MRGNDSFPGSGDPNRTGEPSFSGIAALQFTFQDLAGSWMLAKRHRSSVKLRKSGGIQAKHDRAEDSEHGPGRTGRFHDASVARETRGLKCSGYPISGSTEGIESDFAVADSHSGHSV